MDERKLEYAHRRLDASGDGFCQAYQLGIGVDLYSLPHCGKGVSIGEKAETMEKEPKKGTLGPTEQRSELAEQRICIMLFTVTHYIGV